jgi:sialate O-acetylesterase
MNALTTRCVIAMAVGAMAASTVRGVELSVASPFSDHMVLQREMPVPVWGSANPGEEVTVAFAGQKMSTTADVRGAWMVKLDAMDASADGREMEVTGKANSVTFKDVLVGEVWLGSGQSNMAGHCYNYVDGNKDPTLKAWVEGAPYPKMRLYVSRRGWKVADEAAIRSFSAHLFSFGYKLRETLGVPIGLMVGATSGSPSCNYLTDEMVAGDAAFLKQLAAAGYDSLEAMNREADAKIKAYAEESERRLAAGQRRGNYKGPPRLGKYFHKSIESKIPYAIRGVLWDQGESDTRIPGVDQYVTMNALIRGWRKAWGQGDFPFLHVQKPSGTGCAWDPENPVNAGANPLSADIPKTSKPNRRRMAHVKMGAIFNAPLVQTSDLSPGLHPPCKSGYGSRAARVALGHVYKKDFAISGPAYKSHAVEGSTIRVTYHHVGKGLAYKHADTIHGFAIAAADGKFQPATARIENDTVVLSHPEISDPAHARYAVEWQIPHANLFNKDGLPAVSFMTDGGE